MPHNNQEDARGEPAEQTAGGKGAGKSGGWLACELFLTFHLKAGSDGRQLCHQVIYRQALTLVPWQQEQQWWWWWELSD